MEEDRVRLASVRAPEDDHVGLLNLAIGRGSSSGSEHCRQTGDAGACQVRLQLSMLLLPMTTRVNFCAMKFISLVVLEQLNMPKPLGPSSRAFANPAAAAVESLIPGCRPENASVPHQWLRQAAKPVIHRENNTAEGPHFPAVVTLNRPADPWRPRPPEDHLIGRHESELTPDPHHLPSPLMHQAMVEETDQDQVGKLARTTMAHATMW